MSYDEVEIEDMQWRDDLEAYTYPCPCGDLFLITKVSHRRNPCCSLSLFLGLLQGSLCAALPTWQGQERCTASIHELPSTLPSPGVRA